jgi:hypothetical protein
MSIQLTLCLFRLSSYCSYHHSINYSLLNLLGRSHINIDILFVGLYQANCSLSWSIRQRRNRIFNNIFTELLYTHILTLDLTKVMRSLLVNLWTHINRIDIYLSFWLWYNLIFKILLVIFGSQFILYYISLGIWSQFSFIIKFNFFHQRTLKGW